MFMRSYKAALLTGAVLAAVLAPAGAASAQNLTHDDATADVWEDVWNYDTNTQEYYEAGSQTNVDVLSTVVRHLPTKLVLRFTYADLKRSGTRFGIINHLRFPDGPQIVAAVDTNTRWKGIPVLAKNRTGEPIRCPGLDHAIDYSANTIELTIPRSCIGTPTWVDVNSFAVGQEDDPESESGVHAYIDNSLNGGHGDNGWTRHVRKG